MAKAPISKKSPSKPSQPASKQKSRQSTQKVINPEIMDASDESEFKNVGGAGREGILDAREVEIVSSEDVELLDGDEFAPGLITSKPKRATTPGTEITPTTDPLTLYLAEVRKYPVLTKEEEMVVAKRYFDDKDPEAAQILVRSNLRFVVKVAAQYSKFGAKMIDLIQEGNVGLMHAVKEYNPYKGARLITYAVWWIKGYIQEYLMKQYSMVRIGTTQNQRKLFYQLQKERDQLERMGEYASVALLSEKLGVSEDEVTEMSQRMSGRDVSLDRPLDDESGVSLKDLLRRDDSSLPMDEQLALAEELSILKEKIEELRPQLNEKEKIILDERILSDEPLTLQEIGEKYKITREAVRQAEVRVLKKIKEKMEVGDN